MIYISDEMTPREQEILRQIKNLQEDTYCDAHNHGYDEGYADGETHAWDEARNKGYDEGWEDACQYILDTYLERIGFIHTPSSGEEIRDMVEAQYPGSILVGAVQNYIYKKVENMKVNKDG